MTCASTQIRYYRFMMITMLLVLSLIGCQGTPAPVSSPTVPAPSANTTIPTSTPGTTLGDTPAPLTVSPWPPAEDEILRPFDYDEQAPLEIEEKSVTELSSYTNLELTYASPKGGRVPATLLVPSGASGPFAGIILMHGLPGDRTNNASFARGLVATGAVVLMIDAPFARPENRDRDVWPLTFDEVDRLEQIQLMIDLRRGVDLLIAREDVDPERLAYIGYSYGAAMGGLLAGIEPRIKVFGLMVGDGGIVPHFTDSGGAPLSELERLPDEQRETWLALMKPIEPICFIGRAAPGSLFFQNALRDEAVTQDDALAYQAAGSAPKKIEWYESGHFLPDEAFQHMADWLGTEIGIDATQFTGP
jgi:uncharacterized protein